MSYNKREPQSEVLNRVEKKVYKTCPWGKPKEGYQFALCNEGYCELWNKKGNCCSFWFLGELPYITEQIENFVKVLSP